MPLTLKCSTCNEDFTLPQEDIDKIEDTHWCTMDCRKYNALLISVPDKGILPFHEYLHESDPLHLWPKDGKGTFHTEF